MCFVGIGYVFDTYWLLLMMDSSKSMGKKSSCGYVLEMANKYHQSWAYVGMKL